MKKFLAILLAATSILSFAACGKQQSEVETTTLSDETTAVIEQAETTTEEENSTEPLTDEETTAEKETTAENGLKIKPTKLATGNDDLVFFVGDYDKNKGITDTSLYPSYGLMTVDGEVILPAIYEQCKMIHGYDIPYYALEDISTEMTQEGRTNTTIVHLNGKVVDLIGEIEYTFEHYLTTIETVSFDHEYVYRVYDYNGKVYFEIPFKNFYENIIFHGYFDRDTLWVDLDDKPLQVFDMNGDKIFEKECGLVSAYAQKAVAYVTEKNKNKYGILDIKGNWAIEPIYDRIEDLSGVGDYLLVKNDYYELRNIDLEVVKKGIYNENRKYVHNNNFIYLEKGLVYDALTKRTITSKNGVKASDYLDLGLYFGWNDKQECEVFDIDGKILCSPGKANDYIELCDYIIVAVDAKNGPDSFEKYERVYSYYDANTGEKLLSQNPKYSCNINVAWNSEGKRYILAKSSSFLDGTEPPASLYNVDGKKYLIDEKDDCLDIVLSKKFEEDPLYICAAYDGYFVILDENMNELCRIEY